MTEPETWENLPPEPKKKKKSGCFTVIVILVVLAVSLYAAKDHLLYAGAMTAFNNQSYEAAAILFGRLSGFRDANEYYERAQFSHAKLLYQRGEYAQAVDIFELLGDYEDSDSFRKECSLQLGEIAFDAQDYAAAAEHFTQAEDTDRRNKAVYEMGHRLFLEENYGEAEKWFEELGGVYPDECYPHFMTLEDAGAYLTTQADELNHKIDCYVAHVPEELFDSEELWTMLKNYVPFQVGNISYDHGDKHLVIEVSYYCGDRILQAWRSGDVSGLSEDEAIVLQIAQDLVSTAQSETDDALAMEIWLHDWLCKNIIYSSPNMDVSAEEYINLRELNCVGAILDRTANCQGYTDAFYLLGSMAGFDVCRIEGTAEEGPHTWNGIIIDDKMYFVDVTFDDIEHEKDEQAKTYISFNCAYDPEVYEIDGGAEIYPQLATQQNLSVTYYGYKACVFENMGDAALSLLIQHKKTGEDWNYALIKGGPYDHDDFYDAVEDNMDSAGVSSASWEEYIEYQGGNTYLSVKWN